MPRLTFTLRPALLVACLALMGTGAAAQDETPPLSMEQIEAAWRAGDFATARKGLAVLNQSEPSGLVHYRYGRMLVMGRGGPQDFEQGIDALQKAVDLGNLTSATLLARVLLSVGEPLRDEVRAIKLFSNAAARGNAEAQYYLALNLRTGQMIEQDAEAAFNWFLASSEQEYGPAQYELSRAYAEGFGTPANSAQALHWLERAASNNLPDAQMALGDLYETGNGVTASFEQALNLYKAAAENGQIAAQRRLGTHYLTGTDSSKPDAELAARWLKAAAAAGDVSAMNNLGVAYLRGDVLPQDDALAYDFLSDASDRKLGRATLALAGMVETGRGTNRDMKEAAALYEKATEEGMEAGLQRLTTLALSGALDADFRPDQLIKWIAPALDGAQSEAAQAWFEAQPQATLSATKAAYGAWMLGQEGRGAAGVALIKQAALNGDVASQRRLGLAHSTGDGAALDYEEAYAWLNLAAASNDAEAIETRGVITALMTPDQVAEGQRRARSYFEAMQAQVPQTNQTVTEQSTDPQKADK